MTGFNLVDWGQHQMGLSEFEKAISVARSCGNRRREIWALGIGGWGQLRAANPSKAEQWLLQSIQLCEEIRWVAFQPWPQAMLFEARLLQARLDNSAAETLDEALALSGQLADPCWEAANARAIALLHQDSGDLDGATDWLQHARAKCCAVTDLYAGLLVQILADQLQVEKQRQGDNASTIARELISLAARTHADAYLDQAMDNLSSTNQPS